MSTSSEGEKLGGSKADRGVVPVPEPTISAVVRLADEAFGASGDWWQLPNDVHAGLDRLRWPEQGPGATALRHAVGFWLREVRPGDGRSRTQVDLVHHELTGGEWHPPQPRTVADDVAERWRAIAGQSTSAMARARCADLLVKRGGSAAPAWAEVAMSAYLQLASRQPHTVHLGEEYSEPGSYTIQVDEHAAIQALGRGMSLQHIARSQPGSAQLASELRDLAFSIAAELLNDARPHVGPIMQLLSLLDSDALLSGAQQQTLLHLLERALDRHQDQPWTVDEAAALLTRRAPARRQELIRRRIQARLDLAEAAAQPAVRQAHLEDAARLAEQHNVRDLRDQATLGLQSIDREDLGLVEFSAQVSIPRALLDAKVERLAAGWNRAEALQAWLTDPPPTGDVAANRAQAEQTLASSVSLKILRSKLLGADGMPRWEATNDTDELDNQLYQVEHANLTTRAWALAEALDVIASRFGIPSEHDAHQELVAAGAPDHPLTGATARALLRYWAGDYDSCVHLAVPRVEAAARSLVLELDQPAYRVARARVPGKYVALPELLTLLVGQGLDESWERFFRSLLLGPVGGNYRNDIAHGFVLLIPPREHAALALRALTVLSTLSGAAHIKHLAASGPLHPHLPFPSTVTAAVADLLTTALLHPGQMPARMAQELVEVAHLVRRVRSDIATGLRQLGRHEP